MTFWTYIFANTILSLAVAAILIWTKPENRAKRAEAKMRREEDLFNMMLEAAKRIDEERKPNPEFTPPPTKRKHDYFMQAETDGVVRRWANRGAAFPKDITVCGKPYMLWSINTEPDADVAEYREIKTPTTGSSAIKPKQTDFFIGEIRGGPGNQVLGTVTAKSAEELKEKLEAFNLCETCIWYDDMGYCHNENLCNPEKKPYFAARKVNQNQPFCWYWEQAFRVDNSGNKTPAHISTAKPKERNAFGVDTETATKIAKAAASNAGASTTDEIAEKFNEIANAIDRTDKKPVTPERLKEAGFETEPVSTYRPEEEIIKRYEAVQERLETVRLSAEKALKEQTERFEKLKAAGPAVAPVHSCGSCYWYSEGGGGKFGLCIRNDEIADRDGQKACFDPQERRSKVRPKPIGTVTTR